MAVSITETQQETYMKIFARWLIPAMGAPELVEKNLLKYRELRSEIGQLDGARLGLQIQEEEQGLPRDLKRHAEYHARISELTESMKELAIGIIQRGAWDLVLWCCAFSRRRFLESD